MTEKKVRKHLKRIWFHWYRLQAALQDAHNCDVIEYPQMKDRGSPDFKGCCDLLWELREATEKYTTKAVIEAVNASIRSTCRS